MKSTDRLFKINGTVFVHTVKVRKNAESQIWDRFPVVYTSKNNCCNAADVG